MKSDASVHDLIGPDFFQQATKLLKSTEENFGALVSLFGLNPRSDFRHADLIYADFSNSDLRGFDFTGADLRGATGVNVRWDSTTILTGAQTATSLFAYELERDRFLVDNPSIADQVRRIANNHWTKAILGVEDVLRKRHGDDISVKIAQAVFDTTTDVTVQSNVLYFMKLGTKDASEHKDFIYSICARHHYQMNIVRAAVRTLCAFYKDDMATLNVLIGYLDHPDEQLRSEALRGILASRHLHAIWERVLQRMLRSGKELNRRMLVGAAARLLGPIYQAAAFDVDANNYLDYAQKVSETKIFAAAKRAIVAERVQQLTVQKASMGRDADLMLEASLSVKDAAVLQRARTYRSFLERLRDKYSLPFSFDEPSE